MPTKASHQMIQLTWLPDAFADLERLHEFIVSHSPQAAARAVNTLVDAAESLMQFPEKGKPWELDAAFRELLVRFGARGYVIRYRYFENRIIIVRVWHALENRQDKDPGIESGKVGQTDSQAP